MDGKCKVIRVCHVTSAHDSKDFRIFVSECCSLVKKGYDVYIVSHGESYDKYGVHIIGVGQKPESRKERMTVFAKKVVDRALLLDCDIYHLHDPELMRFIPRISKKGKKVVFDSHEDYKELMLAKEWIPVHLRRIVSLGYTAFEKYICKYLDGYIACYHWTKERVEKYIPNVQLVFNYPKWKAAPEKHHVPEDVDFFCYAGGISSQWMHENVIKAVSKLPHSCYLLAGNINTSYGHFLQNMEEWKYVNYKGLIAHDCLPEEVYSKSLAGICLLDYIPQCKGKVGNLSNTKLFEYMVNGLPVICTNFDLWKDVVEGYNCGILVNPHNVNEIIEAMKWLMLHREEAFEMGKRGNKAIRDKYNWEETSKGLFIVYEKILNSVKYKGEVDG